ncbi:hypothetical protein B1207_08220 [Legionella quinlivanii]|uniref:Uncharacterized protein n=1 Tax=Legionella quinlivanii TaxID=45073 RepID=A0A364LJT9_9GAMM|nr:hypothetical protein B1207_08220 [Legionella quinlivanii]
MWFAKFEYKFGGGELKEDPPLPAIKLRNLVLPAKAGIHSSIGIIASSEMDPRLRGDSLIYI